MKHMYQRFMLTLIVLLLFAIPAAAGDIQLAPGEVYCFQQEELAQDSDGILITAVPSESLGRLKLGSRTIRAGDVLTCASLNDLTFLTTENGAGDGVISCIRITDTALSGDSEMTIRIGPDRDLPPIAEDQTFETYKNIPGEITLNASDPEDQSLTINIVKQPRRGMVTVNQSGTITYTPEKNKVGKDAFVYTVTDPAGNTSPEATVRITIAKPTHKDVYADLEHDPVLLAATWLRETGAYSGETVAGHSLFQPDETLSRGEFIAMCVSLTTEERPDALTAGFADDMSTPSWISPYVAEAVKCGYLSGIPTGEGLALLAHQDITRGEAAVIVSGMLNLPEAASQTVMSSNDALPAWAAASVGAALEAGVFDATETDMLLTRREAASLLYNAYHLAGNQDISLLSWAK